MGKKVTKAQFLADVRHEIEMLRQHALPEEKKYLNFNCFNPKSTANCIYGQLASDCKSPRAKQLMDLACKRQMNINHENGIDAILDTVYSDPVFKVNGEYNGKTWAHSTWSGDYHRNWSYVSVLEAYIALKDAKNENIIAYIKGETDTLEL